ncbi:uncharacterized protein L201_002662 [Kwoniella dendrophila CBS 6074]|uniref:Uncharacterized protein n=1 Tax=Kwoniella dendrophila CBS 6074 TaxID=1295534 RepID=A0AAX4JTA1_9TREE
MSLDNPRRGDLPNPMFCRKCLDEDEQWINCAHRLIKLKMETEREKDVSFQLNSESGTDIIQDVIEIWVSALRYDKIRGNEFENCGANQSVFATGRSYKDESYQGSFNHVHELPTGI